MIVCRPSLPQPITVAPDVDDVTHLHERSFDSNMSTVPDVTSLWKTSAMPWQILAHDHGHVPLGERTWSAACREYPILWHWVSRTLADSQVFRDRPVGATPCIAMTPTDTLTPNRIQEADVLVCVLTPGHNYCHCHQNKTALVILQEWRDLTRKSFVRDLFCTTEVINRTRVTRNACDLD